MTSRDFESLYEGATEEQRAVVNGYIRDENRSNVERWIAVQERSKMKLEDTPVRQLRTLASSLGIPGYHLMLKAQLIVEIKEARK